MAHIDRFVAIADAVGNPISAGNPLPTTGGGGGGAVTIADGADVAQGSTTDSAVTGDNPGTISAKLRGLNKILTSVWDSVNNRLKVDGSGVTQPVNDAGGSLTVDGTVSLSTSTTAVRSSVTASLSTQTFLVANVNRKGAIVYHEGAGGRLLYLALGSGAAATDYTELLNGGDSYNVPFGYTGIITGIWVGNIGSTFARVTELT